MSSNNNNERGKLAFSFDAIAADGKKISTRVTADSAKEARANLELQGLRDITLLDNEQSAIKLNDEDSSRRLVFSAEEEQALRRIQSQFSKTIWILFRSSNLTIWLPLSIWLTYEVSVVGWLSKGAAIPAVLLILYCLWFAWSRVPSIMYDKALIASAWGQWKDVERWMLRLQSWKKLFNTPLANHELLFRTATAEAGQGKIDQALARVSRLAHDTSLTTGFYQMRLASLYFAAKMYDKMLQTQRDSHALKPTDTSAIDLATTLIRYHNDANGAEEALSGVDIDKVFIQGRAFMLRCQGMIALKRGQHQLACDLFSQALTHIRQHVGTPLMHFVIMDTRAHYGLALTLNGQVDDAYPHFEASRPLLKAHGDHDLLKKCELTLRMVKRGQF